MTGGRAPDALRLSRLPGGLRALAILLALVLAAAALKFARPVLVPVVGGAFLAVLAQPLAVRLERGLPRWLALTLTMLVMLAGVAAFAGTLGWSVRAVGQELLDRRATLQATAERITTRAAARGIPVPRLPGTGPGAASGGAGNAGGAGASGGGQPARTEGAGGGGTGSAVTTVARTVVAALGELLLALAVAALALAERGELRRRLARAVPGRAERPTLDVVDEAAAAFRRYVWVKSLTSVITGVASGLLALAFGLPLAWVWGLFAFLLEYVPTVGSLLAVVPPTLMALAEAAGNAGGGGFGRVGLVFVSFGVLQIVLGNVIDPKLEGRLMALSPLGVLLSIVVWGWLWGAIGALLAVPLTVACVIACRRIPGAEGVAIVLAGDRDAGDRDAGDHNTAEHRASAVAPAGDGVATRR